MPDDDEFYIEAEETPDFFEEETRISKNPDVIEVNTMSYEINSEEAFPMRTNRAPLAEKTFIQADRRGSFRADPVISERRRRCPLYKLLF